jgi:hypothetical protein
MRSRCTPSDTGRALTMPLHVQPVQLPISSRCYRPMDAACTACSNKIHPSKYTRVTLSEFMFSNFPDIPRPRMKSPKRKALQGLFENVHVPSVRTGKPLPPVPATTRPLVHRASHASFTELAILRICMPIAPASMDLAQVYFNRSDVGHVSGLTV